MGSADNLNLDCLELIAAYLATGDLVSAALVSRSFLAAITPQLYRTLVFHLGNGKKFPKAMTAFDVVNLHPELAVHVHNIDIRTAPVIRGMLHAGFALSCQRSISLCTNLRSFTCLPTSILTSLLPTLSKLTYVNSVRLNATLTPDQAKFFLSMTNVKAIALDSASWNVVDMLPKWTQSLRANLTDLVFYTMQELNETVFKAVMPNLPNLKGLHVIACPKIEHTTVLEALSHTPALESLSITAWESRACPTTLAPLPHLRHLAIDTHLLPSIPGALPYTTPAIWQFLLSRTRAWACPLESIVLRLSEKNVAHRSIIKDLLDAHCQTLQGIYLVNCEVEKNTLKDIAQRCPQLYRLAVVIPPRDVYDFADALSGSKSLSVLHDMTDMHTTHGIQKNLSRPSVRAIMRDVPSLFKIVSNGRTWTVTGDKAGAWLDDELPLKIEKRNNPCPAYWFIPQIK